MCARCSIALLCRPRSKPHQQHSTKESHHHPHQVRSRTIAWTLPASRGPLQWSPLSFSILLRPLLQGIRPQLQGAGRAALWLEISHFHPGIQRCIQLVSSSPQVQLGIPEYVSLNLCEGILSCNFSAQLPVSKPELDYKLQVGAHPRRNFGVLCDLHHLAQVDR